MIIMREIPSISAAAAAAVVVNAAAAGSYQEMVIFVAFDFRLATQAWHGIGGLWEIIIRYSKITGHGSRSRHHIHGIFLIRNNLRFIMAKPWP
jgi:hypothetical protein